MKKMIIVAGLLCVPTIGAGPAKAAIAAVTSPALIPGIYYGVKSYLEEERIAEKYKDATSPEQNVERNAELANARGKFEGYIDGVSWGMGFPINLTLLSGEAKKLSVPVVRDIDKMNGEQKVGFFSGLSMYGTLSAVLVLLRKLPK